VNRRTLLLSAAAGAAVLARGVWTRVASAAGTRVTVTPEMRGAAPKPAAARG